MVKNRKKKLRNIIVNGQNYKWISWWGEYGTFIRIWKNGKLLKEGCYDYYENQGKPVTPQVIKDMILSEHI